MSQSEHRRRTTFASAGIAFMAAWFAGGLNQGESVAADPLRLLRPGTARQTENKDSENKQTDSSAIRTVKMRFVSATWEKVLTQVAEETGSTLVADEFPRGRYSRQDFKAVSRTDAVRILNKELEPMDFRLLEKGQFLVLVNLPTTNLNYSRPTLKTSAPNVNEPRRGEHFAAPAPSTEEASANVRPATSRGMIQQTAGEQPLARKPVIEQAGGRTNQSSQSSSVNSTAGEFAGRPGRPFQAQPADRPITSGAPRQPGLARSPELSRQPVRQTLFQESVGDETGDQAEAGPDSRPNPDVFQSVPMPIVRRSFSPQHRSAQNLSQTLYEAFRDRAEILDAGPQGLPSMRVYMVKPVKGQDAPVQFTLTVDLKAEELRVEGPQDQAERVVRLLQTLDRVPARVDEATRLIATGKNAEEVAKNLQPALQQLVAQNDPADGPPPANQLNQKDAQGAPLPDLVGGIRGDVSVEAMDGVLILKGNQADVDAVMQIIRQIEELSAKTAPDVRLMMLENVDSQALADLLTTVYEQFNQARGRTGQQGGQSREISIFAVGRPNAVLILAPPSLLDSVETLIKQLDAPVTPQTTFKVFRLKHAVASQMETTVNEFFRLNGGNNGVELGGLATRVRIIADVRTNSVVILAQPNDLKEVEKVIQQLDRPDSSTVSEVKVFELRHAVAEDLASSLNQIIQATINPPQTAQGQNQFGGFGAFGGNQGGSTQLREVRSAMLEFLTADGNEKVRLRSGILADIRINSDARSNTVIITAPKESMDLVAKLVERLDKPASTVATIKYYPLKSADATSVQTVLNELFTNTTQQGNQGTNTQVGVQLAGAEEAASVVPLRFSVDVRSNSIVAVGTAEALEVVEALIYRLDDSGVQKRQTTVIRLKNTPADAVATALQTFVDSQLAVLQAQGQVQGQGSLISSYELADRQVVIQAELNTNTLLISASPAYYNDMLNLVKSLDEDLPQVVIQALLVEVTLEDTDEFGIEFGVQDSILFSRGVTGGVGNPGFNFNTTTVPLPNANTAGQGNLAGQALSNLNVGRINSDLGFGGLVLSAGSESVNVLLRALAARRKLEVLSRPQIRTLHNQEALIQVASEVPIVNGFSTGGISGNVPTVEYRQAGLVLQVVPKVGPDGKIQMQVAAQKTTLDRNGVVLQGGTATTGEVRSPIIDGTTAQSTVTVSDQQTVVLGGLITKTTENVTRKVPWLGDLPVIGHGFRFDRSNEKRTELLIFLTPHIVTDDGVNELIKQVEAARLHWTECEAELLHGPIFAVPPTHMDAFEVPDNIPAETYPTFPQAPVNPPAPNPPAPNPPAPAVEEPVIQQMSGEQAAVNSQNNRVQTAGFATSSGRTGASSRNTLLPVRRREEPAPLRPVR